jgi:hypothetical protein
MAVLSGVSHHFENGQDGISGGCEELVPINVLP